MSKFKVLWTTSEPFIDCTHSAIVEAEDAAEAWKKFYGSKALAESAENVLYYDGHPSNDGAVPCIDFKMHKIA